MAKYLAIARGYIDKKGILEPGVEFEYSGKPSNHWMAPLDDAAREAFKAAGFKVASPPAVHEEPGGSNGRKGKGKGATGTPSKDDQKSSGDTDVI